MEEDHIIDSMDRFGFSNAVDTWKMEERRRRNQQFFEKQLRRIHRRQMANERTENEDGIID